MNPTMKPLVSGIPSVGSMEKLHTSLNTSRTALEIGLVSGFSPEEKHEKWTSILSSLTVNQVYDL